MPHTAEQFQFKQMKDVQTEGWIDVIKTLPRRPAAHQLINQTSGLVEYYTPQPIIVAACQSLGFINLDPASSEAANTKIGAEHIFTEADDGMHKPWFGKVWLNHPFGRAEKICTLECDKEVCQKRGWHRQTPAYGNAAWINKLVQEFKSGRVERACCITFACTSENWFQPLMDYPQCFLTPRTNYYLPDGSVLTGVTKGSVVTFLGDDYGDFMAAFEPMGAIKIRARLKSLSSELNRKPQRYE